MLQEASIISRDKGAFSRKCGREPLGLGRSHIPLRLETSRTTQRILRDTGCMCMLLIIRAGPKKKIDRLDVSEIKMLQDLNRI